MKTLYGSTPPEVEALVLSLGLPKFRAKQILEWLYKKHILSWEVMKSLP